MKGSVGSRSRFEHHVSQSN